MSDWLLNGLLLAQADQAAAETVTTATRQAESAGPNGWVILAVVLAIFALPMLLGNLLARALKLKEFATRISVVLLAITLGVAPFAWHLYDGYRHDLTWQQSLNDSLRWGIDLKGGTNLIFEVDHSKSEKEITDEVMDQMVAAISKRINPGGVEEIVVRRVGFDRIEVIIPGVDPETVQQTKDKMVRLGSLEFAILANSRDHDNPRRERGDVIPRALALPPGEHDLREDGRVIASWREVGVSGEGEEAKSKDVGEEGQVATRPGRTLENGEQLTEFLVVFEPENRRVTGQYLQRVGPGTDESGGLAVDFEFNIEGGRRFYDLTRDNKPESDGSFHRRLAILLDGNIHSAPRINQPIEGRGQISGQFDRDEIDELVAVLNAGALEVPIKPTPVNEMTVGPTLAQDVQDKGINAILWASGAVCVFMLAYYRFAGIVAVMCLVLNLVLVMGTMSAINATFTLPGLAGLVLTIGMAVDSNVLIFERIREELHRGSSLRMSIQNGFNRAFSAILDSNVTTLLTAVVLYMIGTDQIRGFAVTLFIGLAMSMFTALYFSRLVFDISERKRWRTDLKMNSLIGPTNWNFISKGMIAFVLSLVLISAGLAALFVRGARNLDIDFTGGTMATLEFVEPVERTGVKDALDATFDEAVSLEELQVAGTEPGTRFRMRTTMRDADAFDAIGGADEGDETVRSLINAAFQNKAGYELKKIALLNDSFDLEAIPAADTSTGNGEEAAETPPARESEMDEKFRGGYRVELSFSDEIKAATASSYLEDELAKFRSEEGFRKYENAGTLISLSPLEGSDTLTLLASDDVAEEDLRAALAQMKVTMAASPLLDEVNSFASSVATEMQQSAILAMLASMVAIVGYLWFRFHRVTFGLAAAAAIVHDLLFMLAMVGLASFAYTKGVTVLGLEEFKINLPMVAAFMTVIGYSLNDTIVIFDRLREVRGKNPNLTVDMLNISLNQTLSRTLLTAVTTLVVVGILYALGGEGIHGFAFCMVVGVIAGTYSTVYIASPVLLWLTNRSEGRATATAGGRN